MATARTGGFSEEEWSARVDLATLYHMLDLLVGWEEGIYTHAVLRIPGDDAHMLIKRHELLYGEVTAENLVKVPIGADVDESFGVNRPGLVTHSGALSAREGINCSIHCHTEVGLALAAHAGGLRMLTQNALRFWRRVGYHDYEGLVTDHEEGDRIASALRPDNIVLVMRNHGLLIVGNTVRDAFERTRDLLIAARTQLTLEASGAPVVEVPPETCDLVVRQWEEHDRGRGTADWPAWKRKIERERPSAVGLA
ncbi:aldolase [Sphingomonas sp. 36D10-4-7]|uniref:Aldolase n=2 Tax=Sphingomonas corticis TaxID=2722791 RepID=A0ABX1CTB4_9SPHN|nr:aldolase [Sphingomonas corticis]